MAVGEACKAIPGLTHRMFDSAGFPAERGLNFCVHGNPSRGCKKGHNSRDLNVSWCGLVVRRLAGRQKDLGSIGFGSPFSSLQKLWFMDTV